MKQNSELLYHCRLIKQTCIAKHIHSVTKICSCVLNNFIWLALRTLGGKEFHKFTPEKITVLCRTYVLEYKTVKISCVGQVIVFLDVDLVKLCTTNLLLTFNGGSLLYLFSSILIVYKIWQKLNDCCHKYTITLFSVIGAVQLTTTINELELTWPYSVRIVFYVKCFSYILFILYSSPHKCVCCAYCTILFLFASFTSRSSATNIG